MTQKTTPTVDAWVNERLHTGKFSSADGALKSAANVAHHHNWNAEEKQKASKAITSYFNQKDTKLPPPDKEEKRKPEKKAAPAKASPKAATKKPAPAKSAAKAPTKPTPVKTPPAKAGPSKRFEPNMDILSRPIVRGVEVMAAAASVAESPGLRTVLEGLGAGLLKKEVALQEKLLAEVG